MSNSNNPQETPEQRAKRLGVPYVKPARQLPIVNGNPVVAVCGGCGRDVYYMEGYSCPRSNCPITNRPTFQSLGVSGIPTGFEAFDKVKGGFPFGQVHAIGSGVARRAAPNSGIQGFGVDMLKDNPEANPE